MRCRGDGKRKAPQFSAAVLFIRLSLNVYDAGAQAHCTRRLSRDYGPVRKMCPMWTRPAGLALFGGALAG